MAGEAAPKASAEDLVRETAGDLLAGDYLARSFLAGDIEEATMRRRLPILRMW